MRVLITGGAGFVGSHLADHFIAKGDEVVVVDNFITGHDKNIRHLLEHPRFTFKYHDVSEHLSIDGDIDAILHFASPASPIDYLKYPIQTLKVGSLGTHNMLGLALAKKARFLLASTSEIYGDPLEHPQKETYWGNVSTIGPRGVYDEAKRFAESITMAYHRTHYIDTHIVRIFNTYGPRMRLDDGRVVPNFIRQSLDGKALTVYGDGMQTRSFQYISDLVDGLDRLLFSDFHEPVNIGNPNEMTIIEFAEIVNQLTDNPAGIVMKPELRIKDDPQTRKPDITRAKEILGWEPKVSLEVGLQKTIEYFNQQGNR